MIKGITFLKRSDTPRDGTGREGEREESSKRKGMQEI